MPSSLGPAEILVILVVALIVLGPKRLPEAGRQVGKALSEVRRWSQDVKYEMSQAFESESAPSMPPADSAPAVTDPVAATVVPDPSTNDTPSPDAAPPAETDAAPPTSSEAPVDGRG